MKTKTQELSGAALDYACIVAGEWTDANGTPVTPEAALSLLTDEATDTDYSTDWAQGGPIIEREQITLSLIHYDAADINKTYWVAGKFRSWLRMEADTPLIAAMRCYVASKLGDEVEIPEELTQ